MFKKYLKNISLLVLLKRVVRAYSQISLNYMIDCIRYIKYSSSIKFDDDVNKLEGRICVFYHALEKGLSLPNPKKGFGEEKTAELIKFTLRYAKIENHSTDLIATVSGVLKKYFQFNNDVVSKKLLDLYELQYIKNVNVLSSDFAGTSLAKKSDLAFEDYEKFVKSRRSIRKYLSSAIPRKEIEECINIARYTPSVCNRQPWKAYIYQGENEVQKALSVQQGNKGFCDSLNSLILVTADRTKFWHALERNQAYIDGGMFSMSIVNALHAKGLGSCCLNLSLTASGEKTLKKKLNIADSEIPIMMITVVNYVDGSLVAASERMPLEMFLGN